MEIALSILNVNGHYIEIKQVPIECPYCHVDQVPVMYNAVYHSKNNYFIFCMCSNAHCKTAFNIQFNSLSKNRSHINFPSLRIKVFSDVIKETSKSFCEIYNQAFSSEQMGLDQISGVGYRKALEFLIKDYLISLHPEKEDAIKSKMLGRCIKEDVTNINIKNVAERAAWLGNDETHYVRKWEDKDISHLKGLIDLCLHWIEAEIITKRILEEMPG